MIHAHSSGISFSKRSKKRHKMGIISLVDVAFFLLIFFMVAGTIQQVEMIEVSPPEAESGTMVDKGNITILLGARGEIVIDEQLVSMDVLTSELKLKLLQQPNHVITVKADAQINAVQLVDVMDRVQQAGGKQVTIATDGRGKR